MADKPLDSGRRVDIAHEALISGWPQLQHWLSERRDAEQTRRRLESKTEEWVRLGRADGGLLDAAELPEARRWLERPDASELGASENLLGLVAASQDALNAAERQREDVRQRELAQAQALAEEQRQRADEQSKATRRTRQFAGVTAIIAVAALLFAGGAWKFKQVADQSAADAIQQANLNLIQALAAEASNQSQHGEHELGALLARQAFLFDEDEGGLLTKRVDAALRDTLEVPVFNHRFHVDEGSAKAVAISPDGLWLAAGNDKGVMQLWNLAQLQDEPSSPYKHESGVNAIAFSADGQWLASAGKDKLVQFRNLADSGVDARPLDGHGDEVIAVAFSPTPGWLASAAKNQPVRLWDLSQPRSASQPLSGTSGWVKAIAYLDSRHVAVADENGRVRSWDVDHPDEPSSEVLKGQKGKVNAAAFSADGLWLASAGVDGSVRIWNLDNSEGKPRTLLEHAGVFNALAFSADGQWLAAAGQDGIVRLFDLSPLGAESLSLIGHVGSVNGVALSADGRWVASAGEDGTVRLWDRCGTAATPRFVSGHEGKVTAVAFSSDDRWLASAGEDGSVRLLVRSDVETESSPLPAKPNAVQAIAFSPNGQWLAAARRDGVVQLWNVSSDTFAHYELARHPGWDMAVAFSPDGRRLVSVDNDKTVRLWDLSPDLSPSQVESHHLVLDGVIAVAFRDNQHVALVCSDGAVWRWDVNEPEAEPILPENWVESVSAAVFSSDGQWLVVASPPGLLWLRNLDDAKNVLPLKGQANGIKALASSADGRWLASAEENGTVGLWDLSTPDADPHFLAGRVGPVTAVALSSDGRWVAFAGEGGTVGLSIARVDILAEEVVCSSVWRNLSPDEWSQFVGVSEIAPTCPHLPSAAGSPAALATPAVASSASATIDRVTANTLQLRSAA